MNLKKRNCSDWSTRHWVLVLVTLTLLILTHTVSFAQQQNTRMVGLPTDWTHSHIIFSNPGTLQESAQSGNVVNWYKIMNDPRYQLQQIKRTAAGQAGTAFSPAADSMSSTEEDLARKGILTRSEMTTAGPKYKVRRDWTIPLAGGSNFGVAQGVYPAKYTFSPIGSPSCTTDYVVFPINTAGAGSQANLLGVNNLYGGTPTATCSGAVPKVLFAYNVGSGKVQTSPVLSLDGTKVAFVESVNNASVFHVLTLDQSGNAGCPSSSPCNGTAYNSPAVPGTHNSAVNTTIAMHGSVSVTRSSAFVDYASNVAYAGDDSGFLHKFTGVFSGSPAEVVAGGWPVTVAAGVILTSPVYDGTSQNVFVGGSNGTLYYVRVSSGSSGTCNSGSPPCLGNATVTVGTGAILSSPIVDGSTGYVFAAANGSTNAQLVQAPTNLSSSVVVTMGKAGNNLYDGTFDNAYYSNPSTGYMYFCGNDSSGFPALLRVGFDTASPKINSANDGNSFSLASAAVDCTPLTEVYNGTTDYLFLGLTDHGFTAGSPNCNNVTCVASFVLTSTFLTGAHATLTTNLGNHGLSGMIIGNVSPAPGASEIYFGNLQNQTGVQASQAGLQ